MSYISANLNFLINAVKKGAASLTRDFNEIEQLQTSLRGHKEFALAAFERVNKALRVELQKGRPSYPVVTGSDPQPQVSHFLISPLDGLVNFMHAVPYFAVSVAVVENSVITAAVIFNPATSDLYFAEKGNGAFKEGYRNHERLRVSTRKDMADALVGTLNCRDIPAAVENIRIQGSVALDLAYTASGRLDAVISSANQAGNIAAGILIVKEAGGHVYELNQKDIRDADLNAVLASGSLIAVNAELGKKLHAMVNI